MQRTASEVSSLLERSEGMLDASHPRSQQLREITSDIRALHTNFETRFASRAELLQSTIEFYRVAQEVGVVSMPQWVWFQGGPWA